MEQRKFAGYLSTKSKNVLVSSVWEGNNSSKAATKLTISLPGGGYIRFDGKCARQFFRTLQKHYNTKGK